MDVAFDAPGLRDTAVAELEDVLAGIRWPAPRPDQLRVVRQLAGGRSGARVLLVDVRRSGVRVDRRVIKVDRADMMAREWQAAALLRDRGQAALTPLETGSIASADRLCPRSGPDGCGPLLVDLRQRHHHLGRSDRPRHLPGR